MPGKKRWVGFTAILVMAGWCYGAYGAYPIAGLKPYERPAGAPVITGMNKDKQWYEHGLTGVKPPYPTSLYFLDRQGNWFTPFTRPGMTGPYDIRGWHK
ncbi:MAG: hypothetical protein GY731_01415 [Gammaproteobacteria bacterium]|nr:hypothetical protein [Gammaproteobacteria bacterium]